MVLRSDEEGVTMSGYWQNFAEAACETAPKFYFWLIYAGFIVIMAMLLALLASSGRAVELSISGQSLGSGIHSMQFLGDCLNVSIVQGNDSAAWRVIGSGSI